MTDPNTPTALTPDEHDLAHAYASLLTLAAGCGDVERTDALLTEAQATLSETGFTFLTELTA